MVYKNGLISLALSSALVMSMTGCDADATKDTSKQKDTSTTTNTVIEKAGTAGQDTVKETTLTNTIEKDNNFDKVQATGTVLGAVIDTNGNPIANVQVGVAGKSAITDATGNYVILDVPVVDVAGADASISGNKLLVTISAPDGYLGAAVTVEPKAQIDSAEGAAAQGSNGHETFIDGFAAQAGTAVLPALTATVTGRLESAGTEASIAGATVALDFIKVNSASSVGANVATSQNTVATTYATGTYTGTTDANGNFTIANVPADANLSVVVANYTVSKVASTDDEVVTTNIGDVTATPIINSDTAAPYVYKVVNTITNDSRSEINTLRAMLDDDTRGDNVADGTNDDHHAITVYFAEPMDPSRVDDNSVILKSGTKPSDMADLTATTTMDASGTFMTVETDAELASGSWLDINLLVADFVDTSGNFIDENATTNQPLQFVDFANSDESVLRLRLQVFKDINTNAAAVTAEAQVLEDLTKNTTENIKYLVQDTSDAFTSVVDLVLNTEEFSNLNDTDSLADERLTALATALNKGNQVDVNTSRSRITFTPSGAAFYNIKVLKADGTTPVAQDNVFNAGVAVASKISANASTTNDSINNGPKDFTADVVGTNEVNITVSDVNPVELYLSQANTGDTVTITPYDDLGYAGTPAVITLADLVPATTVLQNAYALGNTVQTSDSVVIKGDGGELAESTGAETIGYPYLAITPSMLDDEDASGHLVANKADYADDSSLEFELTQHNVTDSGAADSEYPKASNVYDAQAFATFNVDATLDRTIAVAFSEDVNLNGTVPEYSNGTAAMSNFEVVNNVTKDQDGNINETSRDLVIFDVNNILTLANFVPADGNSKILDFTGIEDSKGNVATEATGAKVVILDKMPPMVESAQYNGASVIVKFNEAIKLNTTVSTLSYETTADAGVGGLDNNATYADGTAGWTLSADKKTLTVEAGLFGAIAGSDLNDSTDWSGSTYAYPNDNYGQGAATELKHIALDWSSITDLNDNNWSDYRTHASNPINLPYFAMANTVGVFGVENSNTDDFDSGDTNDSTQTVILTFNQPIARNTGDVAALFAAAGQADPTTGLLTTNDYDDINVFFELNASADNDKLVAGSGTLSVSLSTDGKILTTQFQKQGSGGFSANSVLKTISGQEFISSYDISKQTTVSVNAD
jgi:hypothetical protein